MSQKPLIRVGPEDVGHRVTLRFFLAEPNETASASDAVGVLLSWPDSPTGELIVEDRHGAQRSVPRDRLIAARRVGG
jgi:hypothetical protein